MPTDRPGHPHTQSAVARYLDRRIEELRGLKTQREIAAEAGYARPNVLSMLKTGETALPLARIPALARALEVDPTHLLRLALVDQMPELAATIDVILGRQLATASEAELFLFRWRILTGDMDPAPNARMSAVIDEMLKQLFPAS